MTSRMDMVVQRQLDTVSTGNGAYLETFLKTAKAAGLSVRVIFAPWRSFGNRPWATIHPRFQVLVDEVVWPSSLRFNETYWSTSPRVWCRFAVRAFKELARKVGFSPTIKSYLATPLSDDECRRVQNLLAADISSIVIAEYSALGPVLRRVTEPSVKGALMHDLMSVRSETFRAQGLEPDFEVMTLQQEAELVDAVELMIYASANEMDILSPLTPSAEAVWLRPEPEAHVVETSSDAPRVVFIGTRHAANTDTLHHFIDDIWPLIRKSRPDVEFWVVGSSGVDLSTERASRPGVKLLGRVELLPDIGGASSVGVSPTRLASGVSIKVAEYLMLGMTCVASRKALEGFGHALDHLVNFADDPQDFAEHVLRLLEDEPARSTHLNSAPVEAAKILSNDAVRKALESAALRYGVNSPGA